MAAQLIESYQSSCRFTIPQKKAHTISKYFDLIVKWFLNKSFDNVNEREKAQMKRLMFRYFSTINRKSRAKTKQEGTGVEGASLKGRFIALARTWKSAGKDILIIQEESIAREPRHPLYFHTPLHMSLPFAYWPEAITTDCVYKDG